MNTITSRLTVGLISTWARASLLGGLFIPSAADGAATVATVEFDIELISMSLSGSVEMPLASDPGNQLGDSIDGYGFVLTTATLSLSSQRMTNPGMATLGKALANPTSNNPPPQPPGGIDPGSLDGELLMVDSFFDVYFDITFTDVDARPGRDFAGQANGATLTLVDNGPTTIRSVYEAIFDKNAPAFGLWPPPAVNPFQGFNGLEIPLGGDINGNGENDKIKFGDGSISAGDDNRTFMQLPNGSLLVSFGASGTLEGAVIDESTDPPFTLGATGPTTATSTLVTPVVSPMIPEPSRAMIALLGLMAGLAHHRRRCAPSA